MATEIKEVNEILNATPIALDSTTVKQQGLIFKGPNPVNSNLNLTPNATPTPDNTEQPHSVAVIRVVQKLIQECTARLIYNQNQLEYYRTAPPEELRFFFLKLFKVKCSANQFDRDKSINIFQEIIQHYEKILAHLNNFDLDKAYLYFRIMIYVDYGGHFSKIKISQKNQEEWEFGFYKLFMSELKPYISQTLATLIENQFLLFEERGVGKDCRSLKHAQKLLFEKWFNLIQSNIYITERDANTLSKHLLDKQEHIEFICQSRMAQLEKKQKAMPRTNLEIPTLIEQIEELKEAYDSIEKILIPIRQQIKCVKKQITYLTEFNSIVRECRDICAILENYPDDIFLTEFFPNLNLRNIPYISHDMPDMHRLYALFNKLRAAHTYLCEFVNWFLTFREKGSNLLREPLTSEDGSDNCDYAIYKVNQYKKFLEIKIADYQNLLKEARDLWNNANKVNKRNIPVANEAAPVDVKLNNEVANIPTEAAAPQPKKEKRPVIKKIMTKEQWLQESKLLKEAQQKEKKQKRELELKAFREELDRKALSSRLRELTEGELKKREERIAQLKLNENITSLLTDLYNEEFSFEKLEKLINALKNIGEIATLTFPKGGSAHCTITLGTTIGYFDEADNTTNGVEKGKSFKPHHDKHLKNNKNYPKHIIKNIQSVFTRAGFSRAALQLKLDKMVDFVAVDHANSRNSAGPGNGAGPGAGAGAGAG